MGRAGGGGHVTGHPAVTELGPHHYRHIIHRKLSSGPSKTHSRPGKLDTAHNSEGFPLNLTDSYFSYVLR